MILCIGQGLKILYRVYHPYAISIFGQCLSLLAAAMIMTVLKFMYSPVPGDSSVIYPILTPVSNPGCCSRHLNPFRATSFFEFMASISVYTIVSYVMFLGTCFVFPQKMVVDVLGLIANLTESFVSLPVFYRVVILHEVYTVSPVLVLQYYSGDLMKLALFWITHSPWPFFVGGFFQLSIDTILFLSYLRLRFCQNRHADEEALVPLEVDIDEEDDNYGNKEEEGE
jgi:hypothetical protein